MICVGVPDILVNIYQHYWAQQLQSSPHQAPNDSDHAPLKQCRCVKALGDLPQDNPTSIVVRSGYLRDTTRTEQ